MNKRKFGLILAQTVDKIVNFYAGMKLSIRAKILTAFLIVFLMMGLLNTILLQRLWQYHAEYDAIIINIVGMALTIIFSIGVAWLISASIYRPIKKLHDSIVTITQKDIELPAATQVDEITELGMSFQLITQKLDTMTAQLRQLIDSLEEQVRERTADLTRTIEIGQQATAIRNLNELLPTITKFIWQRFHIHYTQVYLVDDIDQKLVWKAGAGEVSRELDENSNSLLIDSSTLVGQAAVQRQPVVVTDVQSETRAARTWYSILLEQTDTQHHKPVLPETRSELAIPLIVQGRVIGVLDMQHDIVNTFTDKNLPVYEAMAVQLAIAVDSARQWALAQEAQHQTEEALKQLTREAWTERLLAAEQKLGFVYDLSEIMPVTQTRTTPQHDLTLPLVIQEQTIGYLTVNTPPDQTWTEDEQALLQAVTQQLAQKVESLRLFEDTRQRATREQIARRIIDKVRASRSIETALKTATEELNKALGTARAVIDLQLETQPPSEWREETAGVKATAVITPTNGRPAEAPVNIGSNLG
jgi:GAF domain-containing protein